MRSSGTKKDLVLDETVKKLILLFVLDRMEIPLTEESIVDICTNRNEWLTYMDCQDALAKLLVSNLICKLTSADVEVDPKDIRYTITLDGRNCLAHFYNRIRQHTREDIAEYAKQNRMVFKRKQEYVYEYFKNNDGTHTLVLRIKDPTLGASTFEIRLKATTRNIAVSAGKKWEKKAAQIYEYIFENLISET